jgi:hypothetical protein
VLRVLREGVGAAKATDDLTFPIRFLDEGPHRIHRTAEGGITLAGDTRRALDSASLPGVLTQLRSLQALRLVGVGLRVQPSVFSA